MDLKWLKLSFEQIAVGSTKLLSIQAAPFAFAFEMGLIHAQSRTLKRDKE